MKSLKFKDKNKRILFFRCELNQIWHKSFLLNKKLPFGLKKRLTFSWFLGYKMIFFTQIKNRCVFSNRGSAIYSQFGLSRIFFRDLSSFGNLNGLQKASW